MEADVGGNNCCLDTGNEEGGCGMHVVENQRERERVPTSTGPALY